jgi:23S rRNA pseudouridine2605 synthase
MKPKTAPRKPGYVALERALSKLGIASRTEGRKQIIAGKVRVNGVVRSNPLFPVFPERAKIEMDGLSVGQAEWTTLFLYKPRGVVTTHSDEKGRKTVFSLLPDSEKSLHLNAVGRLDWATSGLLILTNDTRVSAWLTDPKNGVPRVYLVTVRGKVTSESLAKLARGIDESGEKLTADEVSLRKASKKESHLTVQLKEGKNREIRRMFEALGHEVTRLKRVSYGPLGLGELKPGESRQITVEFLKILFPGIPVRGNP